MNTYKKHICRYIFTLFVFLLLNNFSFSQNSCENALVVTAGTYTGVSLPDGNWYTYTATQNCKITAKVKYVAEVNSTEIKLLSLNYNSCTNGCDYSSDYLQYNNELVTEFNILSGDEIFINTGCTKSGVSFTMSISISNADPGYFCQEPIIINNTDSKITFPRYLDYKSLFYEYTVQNDCSLRITDSTEYNNIEVFSSCDKLTDTLYSSYEGDLLFNTTKGTKLLIKYTSDYSSGFDWYITEEPTIHGTSCEDAVEVTKGVNHINNELGKYWTKYVADSACVVSARTFNNYNFYNFQTVKTYMTTTIHLYLNSCDSLVGFYNQFIIDNENNIWGQTEARYELDSGDVLYMVFEELWNKPGQYDMMLSITDTLPGYSYNHAIPVSPEQTSYISPLDTLMGHLKFYSYTPEEDAVVTISLSSKMQTLLVFDNDIINFEYEKSKRLEFNSSESNQFRVWAGKTYNLVWVSESIEEFTWTFSKEKINYGIDPWYPVELDTSGIYKVDNSLGEYSFHYVADSNCRITVSTLGLTNEDTYFTLSKSIGEYVTYDFDNLSDTVLQSSGTISLIKGEGLNILFYNTNTSAVYNTKFTVSGNETGDLCVNPIVINDDYETFTFSENIVNLTKVYSFAGTKEGRYIISDSTNVNLCRVYVACPREGYKYYSGNGEIQFEMTEDKTYYIVWENSAGKPFDWTFRKLPPIDGESVNHPFIADTLGNYSIINNTGEFIMKYTATSDGVLYCSNMNSNSSCMDAYLYVNNIDIPEDFYWGCIVDDGVFNPFYVCCAVSKGDVVYLKLSKYNATIENPIEQVVTIGMLPRGMGYILEDAIILPPVTATYTIADEIPNIKKYYKVIFNYTSTDVSISWDQNFNTIYVIEQSGVTWASYLYNPVFDISFNSFGSWCDIYFKKPFSESFEWNINVIESNYYDTDNDGIWNYEDPDDDNDGVLDIYDRNPLVAKAEEVVATGLIYLYPNPADDVIKFSGIDSNTLLDVFVFSQDGKNVLTLSSISSDQEIDISNLAPSLYSVKVVSNQNMYNLKFVKKQ